MTDITFGFEAEFTSNVEPLTIALESSGLASFHGLHQYHCSCLICESIGLDEDGPMFRFQRDSSCAGEVISKILLCSNGDIEPAAIEAMCRLEEFAVEMDVEPGFQAGFHVHVGTNHSSLASRALFQVLLWEPVLVTLAAGRYRMQRNANRYSGNALLSFMNDSRYDGNANLDELRTMLWDERTDQVRMMTLSVPGQFYANVPDFQMLQDRIVNDSSSRSQERAAITRDIHNLMRRTDRHQNINTQTNHNTFEFRFWNATRSAWRMEMFVGLSVAFMDTAVVQGLEALMPIRYDAVDDNIPMLLDVLRRAGYNSTVELIERQIDYRAVVLPEVANGPFLAFS